MHESDAALVGRAVAGDTAAFTELLHHDQAVHAYLARRSGRQDAMICSVRYGCARSRPGPLMTAGGQTHGRGCTGSLATFCERTGGGSAGRHRRYRRAAPIRGPTSTPDPTAVNLATVTATVPPDLAKEAGAP